MRSKILARVLLGMMLVVGGMVEAQGNMSQSCVEPNLSGYGNWKPREDGECTLGELVSIEFNATYPKELAERSPFARSIMFDYLNEERRKFWEISEFTTRPDNDAQNWIMSTSIKSDAFEHSDTIASVLFQSLYLEGQGRIFGMQTFTFDLQTEKVLTLEDIFIDGIDPYITLAPFAREALAEIAGDCCHDADLRLSAPIHDNYSYWALTDKSLLLFYSGFDVTGMGASIGDTQTVEIPLADLSVYLKPEFLPKST